MTDFAQAGRGIVDAALYMVLATSDRSGRPWPAPVYFAHRDYRELIWVSKPEAAHSLNIEARPEVGIVIFDSSVPIGTGQGVYMSASAGELVSDERAEGIDVFSRRALAHGGHEWTLTDVEAPARLRLYRAVAVDQYVLDANDRRLPVTL